MLAALAAGSATEAASPQQVRFTGRTTADAVLIGDALGNILRFASASRNCQALSAVEASVLPADYVPGDPKYRVGEGKVVYERWDANLCGEVTTFLVHFWPSPQGGTMFSVSYPYPPDAPARPAR
jgi:hypothetical protein